MHGSEDHGDGGRPDLLRRTDFLRTHGAVPARDFSAWAGINYPNEHATPSLLIGGGLITLANVLVYLKPLPKT